MINKILYILFIYGNILIFGGYCFSHRGRTNADGCHNDRINGGYHCHRGNGGGGGGNSSSYIQPNTIRCRDPNSHLIGSKCYCNKGYYVNNFGNCEYDWNQHCSNKFPGTIYRSSDKQCICPGDNPMGWNSKTKSCEKTHEQNCIDKYGINSIPYGNERCLCKEGYIMNNKNTLCIRETDSQKIDSSGNSNSSGGWGRLNGLLFGSFAYFGLKKLKA